MLVPLTCVPSGSKTVVSVPMPRAPENGDEGVDSGAPAIEAEQEAARAVDRGQVGADIAHQRAADFGKAHAQVDLQRRCHAQAGDDIGFRADEGLHQAFSLGSVFGSGNGAGEQHGVGAHGGNANVCFRHCQRQHLVDAVEVRSDADIGRPDDVAGSVAGVDRGLSAGNAEDIQLALRLHLNVGDLLVRHEDVGHVARNRDQLAATDGQYDVLGGPDGGLGGCGACRHYYGQRCKGACGAQHSL